MPTLEKQVRVFISSTFRDMHAERDHLVTVVFPELRERVEQLGLEFFDVDLRWGVPEKGADGETANSWEYCKQWIDRVEPFFVCMLGQRYGWVPKPGELKDKDTRTPQEKDPRSITDMEVRYAVLDSRRKRRSYFYLRETVVPEPAKDAPKKVWDTYADFVDKPDWLKKLNALKDEIKGCGRPVREYPCDWTGERFTKLDAFGEMVLEDLWSGVLRDQRYVSKEVWRQALGTEPDADERFTDELQPVALELWKKIVVLAKPAAKDPMLAERDQMDAFAKARLRWFQGRDKEIKQLKEFVTSTDENAPRLAVIAAVPGQGKSALIAKLATGLVLSTVNREPRTMNAPLVLTHFIGATEGSANSYSLVKRLLDELEHKDSGIEWPRKETPEGQPKEEPKLDFNSLCFRLAERLGNYAGERKIVILIDALNQLTDGHDLNWLPHCLGPSVRVVISCVDDPSGGGPHSVVAEKLAGSDADATKRVPPLPEQQVLDALDSRYLAPLRVSLGPLTEKDVRTIVEKYLREYCKELDQKHVDTICNEKKLPQARNPLYLLVMLAELRTLGGNDMNKVVPQLIASMSKEHPDTVSLFTWVLARMENAEGFGREAVQAWCLYLAHGRVGMASHELADLLARKLGAEATATALRIERGLRRYLLHRGPQLDFFHGQLRQAVFERYAHVEAVAVHNKMADYFVACAKGTDLKKEWETGNIRGFAECVFHLINAARHDGAVALLTHFPFLLHKTRVGLLEAVFEDYDLFLREASVEHARTIEIWSTFFLEKAHILRRGNKEWPTHKILLQLAVEHADDSPLTIGAEQWLAEGRCDWLWLRRVPRLPRAQKNPCLAVLERHTGMVGGSLALADGRLLSWSDDRTLRVWDSNRGACLALLEGHTGSICGALALADGRLLSWSNDKTLRVWDGQSGACLAVLKGHRQLVEGSLELADGRLLSWSCDGTLRLWESQSGACISVLDGHADVVKGAMELTNGRLLSWTGNSLSMEHTLQVWDCHSYVCLATLSGHTRWVNGTLVLADGRLLSWSNDKTLRVWDGQSGACLAVLEGHTDCVSGALALANGRLLSWSKDKTLRLWNSQHGASFGVLDGHRDKVNGALALADGRLVSWSDDKTLRLWDSNSGVCLALLEGHTGSIRGALALADGRLLSWSDDKTLRLWDAHNGICLATLTGHAREVTGALALPDGHLLSWSYCDMTLRLWDGHPSACVAALEAHTDLVRGALALANGRLLSWSDDKTLRMWDCQNGTFLAVLKGHTDWVTGSLALANGRLLSWSLDKTLRLWDCQSGACLAVLDGHIDSVGSVLELIDGRLLSWSSDGTLRLWDGQNGACLAVLKGYTDSVNGALELADGRLLSWSHDIWAPRSNGNRLQLWDSQSGACLAVLKGHTGWIQGAVELIDGRLLSWSDDKTLRVWDRNTGACLALLEGHTGSIRGALALADGRLLSWSYDGTLRIWNSDNGACLAVLDGRISQVLRASMLTDGQILSFHSSINDNLNLLDNNLYLWDSQSGTCLGVLPQDQVANLHPEWIYADVKNQNPRGVFDDLFVVAKGRTAHLRHKSIFSILAAWNADSDSVARCLLPKGSAVVTQANGQVCFLKLHHGQRRISLAEAEALLMAQSRESPARVEAKKEKAADS